MTRISWDDDGKRFFEFGVDRGVIFPQGSAPIPWNGLTAVKEAPTDSESAAFYQDGKKYRNNFTRGSFAGTIDALSYPEEFEDYRGAFGFSYRTKLGNDLDESSGYKLHLVYNAQARPLLANYLTINRNPNPVIFSWSVSSKPEKAGSLYPFTEPTPSAHLIIDSTKVWPEALTALEDILYGTSETDPVFPTIDQILETFYNNSVLIITDNGDGTWTADGPDEVVSFVNPTTFQIDWPSVTYLDAVTYTVYTL